MDTKSKTRNNLLNTKKLIIIPAFNEERQIASVIKNIKEYITDIDIVVIDDGSKDMTAEIARKAGAFVIRHPFNLGAGAAVQTGYKYALQNNYDYLLQLDGDGQHHARCIKDMFIVVESKTCDIVFGSRFLKGVYRSGWLKYIGVMIFQRIIKISTGQIITDPTSGYRCMNRKCFSVLTDDFFPCDYPDANIVILLHRHGFKISEFPVTMIPNPDGRYMHKGVLKISYYLFKVILSIIIIHLKKKRI